MFGWSRISPLLAALSKLRTVLVFLAIVAGSGAVVYVVHTIKQAGAARAEIARLNDVLEQNQKTAEALRASHQRVSELSAEARADLEASEEEIERLRDERERQRNEIDARNRELERLARERETDAKVAKADRAALEWLRENPQGRICPVECWFRPNKEAP